MDDSMTNDIAEQLADIKATQKLIQQELAQISRMMTTRRRADNDETGLRFPGSQQKFSRYLAQNRAARN